MQPKKPSPSFPNTESWDDFLDFSRWRVPEESAVVKRLLDNALLYSGNYLWVWLAVTSAVALFIRWRIILAFAVIGASWKAAELLHHNACLLETRDGRVGSSNRLEQDYTLPVSTKAWLTLLAVFILWAFSALMPLLWSLLGTAVLAGVHAVFRPIANERYFLHQAKTQAAEQDAKSKRPSVVHSDGFEDKGEEVEVVDFSNENQHPNLKNRASSAKIN